MQLPENYERRMKEESERKNCLGRKNRRSKCGGGGRRGVNSSKVR